MKTLQYIGPALFAGLAAGLCLQSTKAADVILTGNYLKVGVNDSGSLIDSGFNVGINFDKLGTATFPAYDFLKPGTPFEFYSAAHDGLQAEGSYDSGSNSFGATTVNTSLVGTLSTRTTGLWDGLSLQQDMSYGTNSGFIDFTVRLTNTTDGSMSNVVYARGLDPDQDVYAGGGYETTNTIVSGDLVTGSAPVTDWTIGIYSNSGYAHTPTVRSAWPYTDAAGLLTPRNDGNGDYSINMAWDIGTLAAGETAEITFQYRIADTHGEVENPDGHVPDAGSTALMLLLGLVPAALWGRRFTAKSQ